MVRACMHRLGGIIQEWTLRLLHSFTGCVHFPLRRHGGGARKGLAQVDSNENRVFPLDQELSGRSRALDRSFNLGSVVESPGE
jgi:hypothetical protein